MKWLTKKRMIAFAIALCVVVVGLIAYGVLTHEEAGLLRPEARWSQDAFPLTIVSSNFSSGAIAQRRTS